MTLSVGLLDTPYPLRLNVPFMNTHAHPTSLRLDGACRGVFQPGVMPSIKLLQTVLSYYRALLCG